MAAIVAEILLLRHHVTHRSGSRGNDLAGLDAPLNAVANIGLSRSGQHPSVRSRYEGRTDWTAARLKHVGARIRGFQNSGSPGSLAQERSTRHANPLLPFD